MATTTLLELTKPAQTDAADISIINNNMDLIDAALGQRSRVLNLLDNSCFLPQYVVNQRGEQSYTGAIYGIDRWKGHTSKTQITPTSNGLEIAHTGTSSNATIFQPLSSNFYELYKDKTLTIAACFEGTIIAKSGKLSNGMLSTSYNGRQVQLYYTADSTQILARILNTVPGSTITVQWVALYEGEYIVDTLPSYIPKGYANELLACQQYFRRFTDKVEACGAVDASTITFGINSLGMAGIPSIKVNSITNAKLPCAYLSSSQLSGASVVGMGNATIKSSVTLTPREAGYILMSYDLNCEP